MITKVLVCLMFVLEVAVVGSGCTAPLVVQAVKKSTDSEEKEQPEQKQQSQQKQ